MILIFSPQTQFQTVCEMQGSRSQGSRLSLPEDTSWIWHSPLNTRSLFRMQIDLFSMDYDIVYSRLQPDYLQAAV